MSQEKWDEFKKRWDDGPFYADELDALAWADGILTKRIHKEALRLIHPSDCGCGNCDLLTSYLGGGG